MKKERDVLEAQIRECFGRVVYTHKTHERMADKYDKQQRSIKFWQIVCSALTASGAVGVVLGDATWVPYATAAMSLITLFISGYAKNIDPGGQAQQHRETASDIWNLREGYLCLLADIRDSAFSIEKIRETRDDLQSQLHQLYRNAPHTNDKAYKEAQDRLQNQEDMTFTDKEIDKFLPKPLKKIQNIGLKSVN